MDVGCGKGRFLLSMAKANPEINFLGIDRLLKRTRKVNRKVVDAGLSNVRLLRIEASYAIEHLLPSLSVKTFYIFFPDPWPKNRHCKRRLFTESFVESLHRTLLPAGIIHLATDHSGYFNEIRSLFGHNHRFTETTVFEPTEEERTNFELIFLEQNIWIGRCSFRKKQGSVGDGKS